MQLLQDGVVMSNVFALSRSCRDENFNFSIQSLYIRQKVKTDIIDIDIDIDIQTCVHVSTVQATSSMVAPTSVPSASPTVAGSGDSI